MSKKTMETRRNGIVSLKRRRTEKRQIWESPKSSLPLVNFLDIQDALPDSSNVTHVHKRLQMVVCVSYSPIVLISPVKSKKN